jgi:hypothetical protein
MFRVLLLSLAVFAIGISAQEVVQSAPISSGFVLLDGAPVAPPYILEQTGDRITLNGHTLSLPGAKRGPRAQSGDFRPRRRGSPDRPARAGGHNSLGQVEGLLRLDSLVLLSTDRPSQLISPSRSVAVLNVLTSQAAIEEKLNALANIQSGDQGSAGWRAVVEGFVATPELIERLDAAERRQVSTRTASNPRVNNALSILGFLLAVAALGTLLIHRPDAGSGLRGVNAEPLAMRRVLQASVLLGALAIYDLVATLTFVQSGLVVEVNPIVEGFIHSPIATTVFKFGLTGMAIALLIAMRRHRPAQVAAWWACVINTVLLLRWATVTSTIA